MPLTLKFIGALRQISGKTQLIVPFQEESLKELLAKLGKEMPQLEKIFDAEPLNDSKSNALVLVNGIEISVLNGLETKLNNEDEIVFIPVVHGG